MPRQLSFALLLLACSATIGTTEVFAGPPELTQLAQAQTEPSQPAAPVAAPDPATPDATAPPPTRRRPRSRSATSRP